MLDELIYRLHFAGRAMRWAIAYIVFILVLEMMMPDNIVMMGQELSLQGFHTLIYVVGFIGGLNIFITCWIKDWTRRAF